MTAFIDACERCLQPSVEPTCEVCADILASIQSLLMEEIELLQERARYQALAEQAPTREIRDAYDRMADALLLWRDACSVRRKALHRQLDEREGAERSEEVSDVA